MVAKYEIINALTEARKMLSGAGTAFGRDLAYDIEQARVAAENLPDKTAVTSMNRRIHDARRVLANTFPMGRGDYPEPYNYVEEYLEDASNLLKQEMRKPEHARWQKARRRKKQRAVVVIPTLVDVSGDIKAEYPPLPYPVETIARKQESSKYRAVRNIRDIKLQRAKKKKVPGVARLVKAMDRAKDVAGTGRFKF